MKRNGRNLKMPHVEGMTSDQWSTMTNMQRFDLLKKLKEDEKVLRKSKKQAKLTEVKLEAVEEVK